MNQVHHIIQVQFFIRLEEDEPVGVWLWQSDQGWQKYSPALTKKLERAFQDGEDEVKVDAERFVDIPNLFQRRYDDRNKIRPVKREGPKKIDNNNNNNNKKRKIQESSDEESEEEDIPKWSWQSDNGWVAFSVGLCKKFEKALRDKEDEVPVILIPKIPRKFSQLFRLTKKDLLTWTRCVSVVMMPLIKGGL
jgi:hypothetical protein